MALQQTRKYNDILLLFIECKPYERVFLGKIENQNRRSKTETADAVVELAKVCEYLIVCVKEFGCKSNLVKYNFPWYLPLERNTQNVKICAFGTFKVIKNIYWRFNFFNRQMSQKNYEMKHYTCICNQLTNVSRTQIWSRRCK